MRTARLTDEERGARVREQAQRTSERRRQRLRQSGYVQTVFWLPAELRRQIDQRAAEHGESISRLAERLISAALSSDPATSRPADNPLPVPVGNAAMPDLAREKPATPAERDRRILELHRQGISGREIARRLGIGETTVRNMLKRDQSQ